MVVVEVVTEYEVDIGALISSHPELWEDVNGDSEEFINELIEQNWIQPHDLGEQNFTNIKVV